MLLIDFHEPKLYQDSEIISKRKCLNILIEKLEKNFANFKDYKLILDELDKFFILLSNFLITIEDKKRIEDLTDEIKNNLFKFYLDSNFHNTFLIVSAYCLFIQKEKNIESGKYLRELWLHTKPEDAEGITANQVPVSSDIQFLCNMLFWGGENNDFWYDRYNFDGFHGSKNYLYKYFILLLTHLREKQNKDLIIEISKDMEKEELEFKYSFLKRFNSDVKELISICDDLIKDSDNWIFLFPPKIQHDKKKSQPTAEPKLIEFAAKDQFENTKKWLEDKRKKFEENIKEIETYLPFDNEKVDESIKQIVESFNKSSEISKAASLEEFDPNRDRNIEFLQIGNRPIIPKDCFLAASHVSKAIKILIIK